MSRQNTSEKKQMDDAKRKVLAEKRAHEIVKLMLEENISEEFLTSSVVYLSLQHYQDVTEERAILKVCGYPLCDNTLQNIPKQQYKISKNKVYDLTERKNFCSNSCYKSSEHLKVQIPSSPLWLRNRKNMAPVHLDKSTSGLKGREVYLRHMVSPSDIEATNVDDLPGRPFAHGVVCEGEREETPYIVKNELKAETSASGILPSPTEITHTQPLNVIEVIFTRIDDWLTEKSINFLRNLHHGNESMQEITPNTSDDLTEDEKKIQEKMKLLDERIKQINLGYKSFDATKGSTTLKDSEEKQYGERVERFFRGQMEQKPKVTFKEVSKCKDDNTDDKTVKAVLPNLDTRDQMVIRRRILHQKIAKIMQDLVPTLPTGVISLLLKNLISTFNLTSNNVMTKTSEVPLLAITLLYLLGVNHEGVRASLEQSLDVVSALLTSLKVDLSAIDEYASQRLT